MYGLVRLSDMADPVTGDDVPRMHRYVYTPILFLFFPRAYRIPRPSRYRHLRNNLRNNAPPPRSKSIMHDLPRPNAPNGSRTNILHRWSIPLLSLAPHSFRFELTERGSDLVTVSGAERGVWVDFLDYCFEGECNEWDVFGCAGAG